MPREVSAGGIDCALLDDEIAVLTIPPEPRASIEPQFDLEDIEAEHEDQVYLTRLAMETSVYMFKFDGTVLMFDRLPRSLRTVRTKCSRVEIGQGLRKAVFDPQGEDVPVCLSCSYFSHCFTVAQSED